MAGLAAAPRLENRERGLHTDAAAVAGLVGADHLAPGRSGIVQVAIHTSGVTEHIRIGIPCGILRAVEESGGPSRSAAVLPPDTDRAAALAR